MEARQAAADGEQIDRVLARLGKRCVVLVGMMGAGKTSIGRRLANLLHLPFLDADAEIEKAANMSITEIFAKHGEADFREGGQDRFRCGSKADPAVHGTTRYLDIVTNRRVVSSETIVMDGKRLCASLTTLELTPYGDGTRLKNTTQLASFIGEGMVRSHEMGNNASLDNLVQYFRTKRR